MAGKGYESDQSGARHLPSARSQLASLRLPVLFPGVSMNVLHYFQEASYGD